MDTKSQPSAAAVQELLDSMKEFYRSKKGADVTIQCVKDGKVILEIKAHTAVICPRSKDFTRLLEFDIQNRSDAAHHTWRVEGQSPTMISMLVRYLYELDFEVDSQDKTVPEMHTLANMWCMGERFDIKSLKMAAADKYKIALSRFNIYGNEIGFTIPYFEDFLASVEAVWSQTLRDETPNTNRMLRNQVSMHIQQNIEEWAKKKGCQSRFLESSYRLIFQEIQNQTPDFIMVLTKIRAKYPECLDTESGDKVLGKDSEPIETEVAEDED